jgi:hypothetical protein
VFVQLTLSALGEADTIATIPAKTKEMTEKCILLFHERTEKTVLSNYAEWTRTADGFYT